MGTRTSRLVHVLVVGLLALTACTNAPPPPLVTSSPPPPTTSRVANPGEIVVGVDSIAGGYNPHRLADQSPIATALSSLLLPSVFRPAPDGSLTLDRTLMLSAEVTRTEPYTVTYQLRRDASWSDAVPVAAEDFVYLWEQMRDQPGTIDSAGYRLISNITSADGGKVVEVTFAKPYPGWRSLFGSLLPAHLLKDAPGGWEAALRDSFPASAGPFSIKTLDKDRGEIVLERNERYWAQPAVVDRLILRRTDQTGLADALRAGYDQVALTRTDAVGVSRLQALGESFSVRTVPRSTVISLLLRPVGQDMSDAKVRGAVASMLDRTALINSGTRGGPESQLRADALVRAPSQAGYASTLPGDAPEAAPDPGRAQRLLTEAGYVQTAGVWMRDGRPLNIVVAAPEGLEPYDGLAEEVRRQLTAAGVQVRVVTPTAEQLFTQLTPGTTQSTGTAASGDGAVNIVVAPLPVGANPASMLATNFGCPIPTPTGSSTSATSSAPSSSTSPAPSPLPSPTPPSSSAADNIVGFCDPSLQPTIEAVLTGAITLEDGLPLVEPALWRQAVVIPLYQAADTLVVRSEITGVDAGSPLAGPLANAAFWRRTVK